ncbi:MAG: OmpA family protein [Breznakibacter sp.]
MRKILALFCVFALSMSLGKLTEANAQNPIAPTPLKNWQVKGMAKSALRMGDTQQAAFFLTHWINRDKENTRVAYLLASCHERNREYHKAAHIYDSIYQSAPRTNPYALYKLAEMHKFLGLYPDASEKFNTVLRQPRKLNQHGITKRQIEQQIAGCQMAIAWADTIPIMGVEKLNSTINFMHKESGPLILNDQTFVYGSTRLPLFPTMDVDGLNRPTNKIYSATLENSEWTGGLPAPAPFTQKEGDDWGSGVFSVDKQRFYASFCAPNLKGKMICKIYVSEQTATGWTPFIPLGRGINHKRYSSSQPTIGTCYDPRLEVLYFTSDRPGGAGRKDIWFTVYNKQNGTYKRAQNAGVFINTPANEMSPFYDLTSHRLFFSSDGWPNIGGLDIHYSTGELVTWEEPKNIGIPFNSSFDDLDYVQSESGKTGFFISNRPESFNDLSATCCDDIFTFSETIQPRIKISGKLQKNEMPMDLDRLLGKGAETVGLPTPTSALANKIITVHTIRDSSTIVFLKQTSTDENGEFSVWVDKGSDYTITVKDTSLLVNTFEFTTKQPTEGTTAELKIDVVPLTVRPQKPIAIHNVYYEFASAELSPMAREILDTTLVVLMKKYPYIAVEIGSHTDDKGGEKYNQRLSEKRAAGVVAYLIKSGISTQRLTYRGYGMSQPIAPNTLPDGSDNEEGRQQNRRTEFRIVGTIDD